MIGEAMGAILIAGLLALLMIAFAAVLSVIASWMTQAESKW